MPQRSTIVASTVTVSPAEAKWEMPTSANKPCASADPGSSANARELGGPHGGGPHGTPLRLGTRSRHGRRAPRGAPLHGGRQQQIRGSVPSLGARVLEVRIHFPPAVSQANFGIAPLALCRFGRLQNGWARCYDRSGGVFRMLVMRRFSDTGNYEAGHTRGAGQNRAAKISRKIVVGQPQLSGWEKR
jgi:hypothetical protein